MRKLAQLAVGFFFVFLMLAGGSAAFAADRSITTFPDTDLPGFDYQIDKGVTLKACQQACIGDNLCRAFTYNKSAKWCFLKGSIGVDTPSPGAISGKISSVPSDTDISDARINDLPFDGRYLVDSAISFANQLPSTDTPPKDLTYPEFVAAGDAASAQGDTATAMVAYRHALAVVANDRSVWLKLADQALSAADTQFDSDNTSAAYDLGAVATYSALNAYIRSDSVADRAASLGALAHGLERREMWPESIGTYRASIALVDDASLQARLDKAVEQHGFRIVSNDVDSESADPSICLNFSDALPPATTDLSSYVVVDGTSQIAVESKNSQLCITGLQHGQRYHLRVRAGLPSDSGETLQKDAELNLFVADRSPFVGFANNSYVMPAGLGGGLPITSVNAKIADIIIYRIGDRSIATAVRNGIFQGNLTGYSAEDVANQYGQKEWEGQVDLAQSAPNQMSVTAIPVGEVVKGLAAGAYVVTAKVDGANDDNAYWEDVATQWFIVTDLGLSTVSGEDGVHAFVRSLTTAQPVAGTNVRLVAVNNEILGETTTDADGQAVFAPGLARGEGGRAPQLLVAQTTEGDYAFLDMSKSAFDLTDRGVDGRPSPGPLDLYATTERGVYRPGETVFLTALLRDTHAKAVEGLSLTMEVERPDGVVSHTELLKDSGAGGYFAAVTLNPEAMRGSWNIRLYADPKAAALNSVNFLVEDFEPERLAFEISAPDAPLAIGTPADINVAAKYLYGAVAPGLNIEADTILSPTSTLEAYPGYSFGREDDTFQTDREPLGNVGTTDETGNAVAQITLPQPEATTRPLNAQIVMRLVDANGRTVERTLSRPVLADVDRIGVKPQFNVYDGIDQGSTAGFDVITVAPDGKTIAKTGLNWTLSRIETTYQWYRDNGTWKWEDITTTTAVGHGSVDTSATGPVTVSAPVDWGRYQLEIESDGPNPTSTSYEFYAGYYYADAGSNTPDTLQVALDKPTYKAGDVAHLRLDPQFAGTALVMVVDDRIIAMKSVDVPAEGITVDLPVTADWSPGAYVTATLYRPASVAEKRMPARALGLAFADVEPGDLKLNVALDVPKDARPRAPFTVKVKLDNVAPGDTAYVAVAAVDLGILNLTHFPIPDPDGWYFGQRSLGVEFRDLYGQLIDPTQGTPGALRSGGDESASRLGTPPATSVLVALHSGIVQVAADGTATVTFDMPDFNGSVRVTAMAWSKSAVGHSSVEAIVRDPVVVNLSPPRFLRLDDTSRLLVEIDNVAGPAGAYKVALTTGEGLSTDAGETTIDLAAGARTSLNLGLTGTALGDQKLTLTVTGPTGVVQAKDLTVGVRAASAPMTVSKLLPLAPGASVTLDKSDFDGLVPHTATLTLALGPFARLDVPNLLLSLDRYPYGCAEQISSRAMPLLYLNDVAQILGMGTDEALDQRIDDAIASVLSNQNSNGAFGLWGPYDSADLWLDAYVTDFLLRAKAAGHAVPEQALSNALDNLGNQVSYYSDFDRGGEDLAYALYDLARAGRAAIGDLRYYVETKLDAFSSPLSNAQLGSALALYGDRTRAATAFAAALDGLKVPDDPKVYRADYGTQLRDTAAVLALAAEFKPAGVDITAMTKQLAALRDKTKWTSTQEDAWTLIAAAALAKDAGSNTVTVDGTALTGTVYQRYDQEHFDTGSVTVTNTGNTPTEMRVSVTGIPATPPPASSNGFTISRAYYLPDGTEADLTHVTQNDRFVVVLTMGAQNLGSGQYLVADPLPAGFEIENPDLSSAQVSDLAWLSVDQPVHVEARTDQYVAAFRYVSDTANFSTAYMVRAVSPGKFVMPGATIEDMYRPEFRANTDSGTIDVAAAGSPEAAANAEANAAAKAAADAVTTDTEDAPAEGDQAGLASTMVQTVRINPDGSVAEAD